MFSTVLDDGDGQIRALAERVLAENRALGRTIALAESCTGGMVATALTDVPGSSDVLLAGFVTYADAAKQNLLGVSREIIETFGSVSVACAWAMATGAVERAEADIGVAVSGVAGPDGGSDAKPVGTVVFSRVLRGQSADQAFAERKLFDTSGGRAGIRRQAAMFALELLLPTGDEQSAATPA
ncbi:MAG: CinA family protein [Sphingopyxis sp.]